MHILLPTGEATVETVRAAAAGHNAHVVVTGPIASFLTPDQLHHLIERGNYDLVIISGMCTASFLEVEQATGISIYRGPRHAADLSLILPLLGEVELSRSIPADEFLAAQKREGAIRTIAQREREADAEFVIRGVKIGGSSRIKVLAEIMDAHRHPNLRAVIEQSFEHGADIVDLGFGFDATPTDVQMCLTAIEDLDRPIAIDTTDPKLIAAGLFRADLILSLHEGNIPLIGKAIAKAGIAAVVIPGACALEENLTAAERVGIRCLIADPVLMPVGSGFIPSLQQFKSFQHPLFFGSGNVVELLDADSIGMNALLAGMAMEIGAAVIFTSEHSDKTHGSISEMRRATEMMALMKGRPYPKDLGIDLLVLKEKRRRREPSPQYARAEEASPMPSAITYDPCGNFRIGIEREEIVAVINGRAVHGKRWIDIFHTILKNGDVSLLDHAAYLGAELLKAELAIRFKRSFEQDGPF